LAASADRFSNRREDGAFLPQQGSAAEWTWLDRILFKETVEERFGIVIRVSESLLSIRLENFARYLASSPLGFAADVTEDMIPGYAGELAAMPLGHPEKEFKKAKAPDLIATGGVDFRSDDFAVDGIVEVVIPLRSGREITRTTRRHQPKGPPSRREVVLAKNDPDGSATLHPRLLKSVAPPEFEVFDGFADIAVLLFAFLDFAFDDQFAVKAQFAEARQQAREISAAFADLDFLA